MKRKWILRALAACAIILAVVILVVAFSLGTIVKKGVENIGPQATKVDVRLKSAEVWLLAWRVQLSGLFIGNPPGYKTASAIEADKVSVRVKPGSAFSDKLVVESIQVTAPVITLEGGLRDNNLKKIEKNLDAYTASSSSTSSSSASSTGPAKPERKLQVNELVITGAKLLVNTKLSGGRTITLSIPDIHLTDLGTGPEGVTAAEVGQRALHAVLQAATTAVAQNASGLGEGAVGGAKDAVKKAADSLKGFFHQ
jgi:uncharacterized protein involved in outer membrane biogenesis